MKKTNGMVRPEMIYSKAPDAVCLFVTSNTHPLNVVKEPQNPTHNAR